MTRASTKTIDDRRADYTQLLRQVPQVSQLSLLNAQGREQLRLTRQIVTLGSDADFSRDARLIETASRGTSFAPAYFRGERPLMSIALSHADGSTTVAEIDLDFLSEFLIDAQVGNGCLRVVLSSASLSFFSNPFLYLLFHWVGCGVEAMHARIRVPMQPATA